MTKTEKLRMKALHHSQAADHWERKKIEADEMDFREIYEWMEARERTALMFTLSSIKEEIGNG